MIEHLVESFRTAAQTDISSGGLALGVIASAIAAARLWGVKGLRWVTNRVLLKLEIPDSTEAFADVQRLLAQHTRKSRRLIVMKSKRAARDKHPVSLGPGWHVVRWRGRLVFASYSSNRSSETGIIYESITLTVPFGNLQMAKTLLEDAQRAALENDGTAISVYKLITISYDNMGWLRDFTVPARPLGSLEYPSETLDRIRNDLTTFLGRKAWYAERHIPYRRGVLLEGPPGTGKTSMVVGLATEFKLPIFRLSLSERNLNDRDFASGLRSAPEGSILLIEDIDAAIVTRNRTAVGKVGDTPIYEPTPTGLTLSGLLNALDGIGAQEGCIVVMTTNHPEKLDPALIRPGRIDLRVHLGLIQYDEIKRMCRRLRPELSTGEIEAFARTASGILSPAQVQERLLRSEGLEESVLRTPEAPAYELPVIHNKATQVVAQNGSGAVRTS